MGIKQSWSVKFHYRTKNKGEYKTMEPEKTTEQIYLDQIEELKKKMDSMVDPVEYKKLKDQHAKLLNDYVNRRPAPIQEPTVVRSVKEIAKELAKVKDANITNRDYVLKSLEYRDAHIREYGTDPFSDFGQKGPGKSTDDTQEVANTLKQLLDENTSPVDFRIKLNSVLQDDPQLTAKLRSRRA
jgi:hypothetical protein